MLDTYWAVLPEVGNEATEAIVDLLDLRVTSASRGRDATAPASHKPGLISTNASGGERTRTAGLFVANEAL